MEIKEIIDLTYDLDENIPVFANWHSRVSVSRQGDINSVGRNTSKIILGSHSGTHMDAPLHFARAAKTIEKIPPEKLIGEVQIIDYSRLGKNREITLDMVKLIKVSPRMIFRFNWGRNWNTKDFYKGYPYFSQEAARYLAGQKIELIGMDTPSPDDSRIDLASCLGTEDDSPVHKIFLKAGVVIVEYLAGLERITDHKGWNIVVAPLKVKGSDGAPARVYLFR